MMRVAMILQEFLPVNLEVMSIGYGLLIDVQTNLKTHEEVLKSSIPK